MTATVVEQPDRFWAKIQPTGFCWEWTACTSGGYGVFAVNHRKVRKAHRLSYEALVGPIPEGLQLDHLCRNRSCVNPDHLEPVTPAVNTERGFNFGKPKGVYREERCRVAGHLLAETAVVRSDGSRICGPCRQAWVRGERKSIR